MPVGLTVTIRTVRDVKLLSSKIKNEIKKCFRGCRTGLGHPGHESKRRTYQQTLFEHDRPTELRVSKRVH